MYLWKELATRTNNGLTVSLEWCPSADEEIRVHVVSESQDFTLYPAPSKALDCFHHPFVYAESALVGKVPA
jgi:hypothetical protein